jgi:hypothetical protein
VTSARLLEERFERPDRFDLAAYWTESSSAYERDAPRLEVTVRVHPRRLGRLAGIIGERALAAADRLAEPDPDGWIRLRLRLDWPAEVPATLMAMGADLEAIDPPDLRDRIASVAAAVVAHYHATGGVPTAGPGGVVPTGIEA